MNFRTQSAPPDMFSGAPGNVRKRWAPPSSYTQAVRLAGRKSTSKVGGALQESGRLAASMGKVRIITNDSMTYGTPEWLSSVHHFGMTIRPKKAKMLALPYPGITGRPRSYKGTFIRGKTIYRQHPMNPEGPPQRLFFLKDKVTIPARPHLTINLKTMDWMSEKTWEFYVQKAGK